MLPRLTHATLLRYAGLFTWAMVGSGLIMNACALVVLTIAGVTLAPLVLGGAGGG